MDKKFTVKDFYKLKQENKKITMLTAYDFTTAKLIDESGIDTILVGDSLGMTMLGYESTIKVTMDDMLHHTKAVTRACKRAFVIADMPYMSYHIDAKEAVYNASRLIKEAGANAIKLEGGQEFVDTIKAIIKAQIPVVGHLGLTPQSINVLGGYKVQGKKDDDKKRLIEDALALQEAGVVAIVLECIPSDLAKDISNKLEIPTIGIGAGKDCDGQVLVIQDMLGLYSEFVPKFVKQYKKLGDEYKNGIKDYIEEVRKGEFPKKEHTY